MTLVAVSRFQISREVVATTEQALRDAGHQGFERFVLWTGTANGDRFRVQTTYVPSQNSYKLQEGLCVRVDGSELHKLNVWLYQQGETLAVQIHSHPHEAYHSETDDSYPIVTELGGLSIVVPEFCRDGLFCANTVAYRLTSLGWNKLAGPLGAIVGIE